ncbi:MAG: response regulator [Deltaproteobacteria bacterium]|nr:response regulator [Deltaproteobacteria bacterium]
MSNTPNLLQGKRILIVDDEPDVLDVLEEILRLCHVDRAADFATAERLLNGEVYDAVILDIQGVDGFKLLRQSVAKDFPTVMLTAHAATPESLKKSIELGAAGFLPKESMPELEEILSAILSGGGVRFWWMKSFERTNSFFEKRYGSDWREKDAFFKAFQESLRQEENQPK